MSNIMKERKEVRYLQEQFILFLPLDYIKRNNQISNFIQLTPKSNIIWTVQISESPNMYNDVKIFLTLQQGGVNPKCIPII